MERLDDVTRLVDRIVERVGRRVVVGTPLGLGKANRILDELYRRAEADPGFELVIVTALGLAPPEPSAELERRLVEPMNERLFGGYPVPRFERALRRDEVPPNVTIRTFFVEPGSVLDARHAQQHHVSVGYAEAVDVVAGSGVNVLAQLVAPGEGEAAGRVSLSCNPDLTLDLLDRLAELRAGGTPVVACAELNRNLPYMGGDAEVAADAFDLALDVPGPEGTDFPLFGPPKRPVALATTPSACTPPPSCATAGRCRSASAPSATPSPGR